MSTKSETMMFTLTATAVTVISGLALAGPVSEGSSRTVSIKEWNIPESGRTRDPFAAEADKIWFVDQTEHYIGLLTPSTGKISKRDLPDDAGPHNLIVGSDGIVWYAGNLKGYIGRYDPKADSITKIPMPNPAAQDPHTLVFDAGQKHIWFTVQQSNFVGHLKLADQSIDLVPVPTANARPYGIRMGPDGTPWIALLGTNRLASVDPATLQITEYEIPAEEARPRRVEVTSDGRVWYADFSRGFLGMYDPQSKAFKEWALPSGEKSLPYGMAKDDDDRVWIVETGVLPNQFVGFDTHTAKFISVTPIASGAGAVRHMDYHKPSETVWFGTDRHTIGRALVDETSTN